MNATEIIAEIKQLPLDEQVRVAEFVQSLGVKRGWTPEDFTRAAQEFVAEKDPVRAEGLKEQIIAAFYEE